jgi:splicing factor 3B subunit 3
LKHTPRRFIIHPDFRNFILIESDYNVLSEKEKDKLLREKLAEPDDMDVEAGILERTPLWMREGPVRSDTGAWASCLRIINPYEGKTSFLYGFEENEAAYSVAACGFHSRPGESFLVVGTAKDVVMSPRICSVGYIYVFRFSGDGSTVELVHKVTLFFGCDNFFPNVIT